MGIIHGEIGDKDRDEDRLAERAAARDRHEGGDKGGLDTKEVGDLTRCLRQA